MKTNSKDAQITLQWLKSESKDGKQKKKEKKKKQKKEKTKEKRRPGQPLFLHYDSFL